MFIYGFFLNDKNSKKSYLSCSDFIFFPFWGIMEEEIGGGGLLAFLALFYVSFRDGIYHGRASTSLFFPQVHFTLSVLLQEFDTAFHNFANPH